MNNSIKELVDMYQPDILWGDVPVGPVRDENGKPLGADHWNSKEVIAYFYNHSPNPEQVVTNDRWGLDLNVKTDSPKSLKNTVWASRAKRWGVDVNAAFLGDYQTPERFTVDKIMKAPWETCDSMDPRSWGYSRILPDQDYMTTNELVDYLVDVVSKNGNLLINIGPKADGTIPELMQERLRGIGEWLEVNGEAIYGTTYWKTFKENEFRFTRKGNTLYAIALENPGTRVLLAELVGLDVQSVSLLGLDQDIDWQQTQNGLQLDLPSNLPFEYANTLKIQASSL
jgi:alpha-L-fucosidase